MPGRSHRLTLLIAALGLLLIGFLAGADSPEEIRRVLVTNFPALQQVAGTVSIEGPVRHASLQRFSEILVPPVGPDDTTRLIAAGTLVADGFTSVVLGLNGQTRSKILRPGTVGAILIPEEEPVIKAFEDEGKAQFPIEIKALSVTGASRYFASEPARSLIGFPRYRVWLYNTSDKTVSANLYAYLMN